MNECRNGKEEGGRPRSKKSTNRRDERRDFSGLLLLFFSFLPFFFFYINKPSRNIFGKKGEKEKKNRRDSTRNNLERDYNLVYAPNEKKLGQT